MKSNLQLKNLRHKFSWLLCLMALLTICQEAYSYKIYCKWDGQTEVYAYFFDGGECAGGWRGTKMTSEGNGYYSIDACGGKQVIFNSSGQTGNLNTPEESDTNNCYDKANSKWISYSPTTYTYYLVGFSDGDNPIVMPVSNGIATCTKALEGETTYTGGYEVATGFKIKRVGSDSSTEWYGNNGTMNIGNCTGWTMSTSDNNCGITTTLAGDYTFSFNTSNNQLSVEYPSVNITITFIDNNNWGSCWYYIPNNSTDCNWIDGKGFSPTDDGRSLKKYGQMTKNGNTYTVTLEYPTDMNGNCITFAKSDQHSYGNFHNNEAVYCADFDVSKLICTSTTSSTPTNNTKYFGHSWSGACTTPTVTADDPDVICGSGTPTMEASTTNGEIHWYSDSGCSVELGTGISYTPSSPISETTSYYVKAIDGTCESEVVTVTATVKAQTIARTDANSFNTVVDASSEAKDLKFTQCGYSVEAGDITLVGADAGDFTINSKTISGENITVNVTFRPTTTGSKTVYVQILDASHQFQITATGACKSGVAASNFNFTNTSVTYNGNEQHPTITPKDATVGAVTTVYYAGAAATGKTDAGTYAITIDSEAGTKYCGASKLSLGDFTINKADQTELTLASSAATVCSGNSATLSTTGGSGDGAVTYAITSGTGGSISGNTLTATQAGTFTVQATKAASTNYNAKTSNEVTVTFVAIPATPNATDISVCSGEDATFNATSASGASIDWYDVASGGTLLKENSNNYVVANLTVAKTVYAEAHNLTTGCVSATRKAVAATIKGATLTVSPSSVSTNPYAVTTLTATSTPAESVTWSTTTGYFVDENNKKSDAPVANSVKVKPGETGGNVTATVVSGGCTTNTIVPVTVSADTQDCQ